eukprot:91648_1
MSGQYRLVQPNQVGQPNNPLDDVLCGIYWYKGRVIIALPVGWFVKLIYAWIILNVMLAIWTTFFPHVTFVYSMWWVMCPVLGWIMLRVLMALNAKYNATFNPIAITKLPFLLLCVIIAYGVGISKNRADIWDHAAQLLNHETWLQHLQYSVDTLSSTVEVMDDKFTKWSKTADERYTKWLDEKASVQRVEKLASQMWEGFGLITVTRQHFGLGCFVNGTMVQLDEFGTMKRIEELNEYDMIYNPDLNATFKIKIITVGPEEGFIYEFMTRDALTVSVTKTHPMKVCNGKGVKMECENIAASQVGVGNMTKTMNGYQDIIKINKVPANGAIVYNVWLDLDDDTPIIERTIIANGIHTFDLKAQAMNEEKK